VRAASCGAGTHGGRRRSPGAQGPPAVRDCAHLNGWLRDHATYARFNIRGVAVLGGVRATTASGPVQARPRPPLGERNGKPCSPLPNAAVAVRRRPPVPRPAGTGPHPLHLDRQFGSATEILKGLGRYDGARGRDIVWPSAGHLT